MAVTSLQQRKAEGRRESSSETRLPSTRSDPAGVETDSVYLISIYPPCCAQRINAYKLGAMQHLDRQLARFGDRLCNEVGLTSEETGKVATLVAADIRFLPIEAKAEIKAASPVPLSARFEELIAFQSWSDFATSVKSNPAISRASVIVQNYICFVYLKDACFEVVAKRAASGSVAARASAYLSRGALRDFRNAFSHANWKYKESFSGLECWVLEDARNRTGPMRHFEVSQTDLSFWQALSRGVAYATYEQLRG